MMISKTIGNYKILKELGTGTMGTVYLAENLSIGTQVAIKMLHPHLLKSENIKSRFLKEARAQANLEHPNITKVIDFVNNEQGLFIILELVEGETLHDFLFKSKNSLSEVEANQFMSKILGAVAFAHSKGIVHRDLKLANILIKPTKEIKILGFGIAQISSDINVDSNFGSLMESPLYKSPEQITNGIVDFRSDIYSLGLIYQELLTGIPIYDIRNTTQFEIYNKIVNEPLPRLKEFYRIDSDKAQKIIDTATAKLPASRFQNCEEFKKSLHSEVEAQPIAKIPRTLHEEPKSVVPITQAVNRKEKKKSNSTILVVSLLIVALLGVSGFYFANEHYNNRENESTALMQKAEKHYKLGEYRKAYKIYNSVVTEYPDNVAAKKRVHELNALSASFQERAVDSVMQLYLQTASIANFNPNDSILGYKINTGFSHIFKQLDSLKSSQKIMNEPIVLNKALNDLEIAQHYFAANALFSAGKATEALDVLKNAVQVGQNTHVEHLKDSIENSLNIEEVIDKKSEPVIKKGTVSFNSAQLPPIISGCPYNMKASELRECFNTKFQDYLDTRISPKDYTHLPLKSGIQNNTVSFVIGKDGEIKDVEVVAPHQKIENDIHYALQNLKGIKPGFQNHVPVEVFYKANYVFEVSNSKSPKVAVSKGMLDENAGGGNKKTGIKKSISMTMADRAPVFQGCEDENKKTLVYCTTEGLNHFITEYIDYRGLKQTGVPEGPHSFLVKFKINEGGGIDNIVVETPLEDVKKEVIKIVKQIPQMQPGMYKAQPAIVDYSVRLTVNVE